MPHVLAMVEWLPARLSDAALGDLLTVASRTSLALVSSGNPAAAEKLAAPPRLQANEISDAAVISARFRICRQGG